jgi:hypothetical protein
VNLAAAAAAANATVASRVKANTSDGSKARTRDPTGTRVRESVQFGSPAERVVHFSVATEGFHSLASPKRSLCCGEFEVLRDARDVLRELRRHLDCELLASSNADESRARRADEPLATCARTPLVELGHALVLKLLEDALCASLKTHEPLHGAEAAVGLGDGLDREGNGAGGWNRAHA